MSTKRGQADLSPPTVAVSTVSPQDQSEGKLLDLQALLPTVVSRILQQNRFFSLVPKIFRLTSCLFLINILTVASAPKRSKLDFLAMIAEMSEKSDDDSKKGGETSSAASASSEQDPGKPAAASTPTPSNTEGKSAKKDSSPSKIEAPKSSFAAWKLAKGRKKHEKKGLNRKEILLGRSNNEYKKDLAVEAARDVKNALDEGASKKPTAVAAAFNIIPPKKGVVKKKTASSKIAGSKNDNKVGRKNGNKNGQTKSKKGDSTKAAIFPQKIMEVLQQGLAPKAIYWLPEGEAIALNPDHFQDNDVISKHFRGNKLSSFVRSLNRWGFRRIFYHSLPGKTLAFYHRLFQKNSPDLVKEMKMDGGEKEPTLPDGAAASGASQQPTGAEPLESKVAISSSAAAAAPVRSEAPPASPAVSAASIPSNLQTQLAAIGSAPSVADRFDRNAALQQLAASAEGQQALQQAMAAEQKRSDMALQQLQAQQFLMRYGGSEHQNAAQAEEFLMQSLLAERQRSEMADHQRQAEHALLQQMMAEEQNAAFLAALQGGGGGAGSSSNIEALLREHLLAQQYGNSGAPAAAQSAPTAAPTEADFMALLQQQLQGQNQAREPSYMEQLLLLEQQQQQQRQQEAAVLAARGFRF